MSKFSFLLVGGIILWASAAALAEEIMIEGGGAATSSIFLALREPYEEITGDKLHITMSSPVKGLIALNAGKIDVATALMSVADMIKGADQEGAKIDPSTLQTTVLGENKTLVFLHRSNKIKSLSKAQLKGIFTGKIVNWREVGGGNLPIQVVWGAGTPGQNSLFSKVILDGEAVTPKAYDAGDYEGIRKYVMQNPKAIGIDPQGFKMVGIFTPKIPAVKSPFIAVTKGAPSAKVQRLLQFVQETFSD